MIIKSPITNSENIIIERIISTAWLIGEYQKVNIDVAGYFKDLDEILLCKCLDTGYRFYYPFSVAGDGNFYAVLEIGCGRGGFLAKAMERAGTEQCVGLELNISAVEEGRSRGLDVITESIEVHAESRHNYYDLVCAFQVLEHIPNVREFISSSLAVLKSGGAADFLCS